MTRANGKVSLRGPISQGTYAGVPPQFRIAPIRTASVRTASLPRQGDQPALTITQRIAREADVRPGALAIVVDGSKGNAVIAAALGDALDALPQGLPVSMRIAAETPIEVPLAPWDTIQRARFEIALAGAVFIGGQDNLPALAHAISDVARSDSLLLWVHGPQPVIATGSRVQLDQLLERSESLPRLLRYQARPGPALTGSGQPWFESARFITPSASPAADLEGLLRELTQAGPVWRVARAAGSAQGATSGSIHIARLWGSGEAARTLSAKPADRSAAILLARRLNIVTPVSGAVVLATDIEYKQNGLVVPGADQVPTIPEPHEWALLAIVASVLVWLWRRRHRRRCAAPPLAFA